MPDDYPTRAENPESQSDNPTSWFGWRTPREDIQRRHMMLHPTEPQFTRREKWRLLWIGGCALLVSALIDAALWILLKRIVGF